MATTKVMERPVVYSYTNEFYRLTDRLDIQEDEKFLVLKYVNRLSPYIQHEMEFLTMSMLVDAFHCASKLEAKHKGKSHCMTNPTG